MVTIGKSSCEKQLAVLFNTKHAHIVIYIYTKIRNYYKQFCCCCFRPCIDVCIRQTTQDNRPTAIDTYAADKCTTSETEG